VSVVETKHQPVALALLTDIREWRRSEAELKQSRQEIRALAAQLMTVGEETKKQLARDLHDVLGQKLALLNLEVDSLQQDAIHCETKAKMFEPFFSTKLFGRGLAAVQMLARRHRGCVRVQTEQGRGATVAVFLNPALPAACAGGFARH